MGSKMGFDRDFLMGFMGFQSIISWDLMGFHGKIYGKWRFNHQEMGDSKGFWIEWDS